MVKSTKNNSKKRNLKLKKSHKYTYRQKGGMIRGRGHPIPIIPYEKIASSLDLKVFTVPEIVKYETNFRNLFKEKINSVKFISRFQSARMNRGISKEMTKEEIDKRLIEIENGIRDFNKPIIEIMYGDFINKKANKELNDNKELRDVHNILQTEGKELERIKEHANYIASQGMIAYEDRKKVANESRPAIERLDSLKTKQYDLEHKIFADIREEYPLALFQELFNKDLVNFRDSIEEYLTGENERRQAEINSNPSIRAKKQISMSDGDINHRLRVAEINNRLSLKTPKVYPTSVNQIVSENQLL